jgi:hypothetical protein
MTRRASFQHAGSGAADGTPWDGVGRASMVRGRRVACGTPGRFAGITGLAGLGLALIVWSVPARAQVIDQYLNPDIPGYGAEPAVTVASRAHPEYDPQGIRVGVFTLTPELDESIGYDDNVTGTSTAHGSPLVETNAIVNLGADWGLTRANAALMVDDNEYFSQSAQSYTNWSAAIGGSHDFGQDTLYVGATHLNLNQTPRDLDVPDLTGSVPYRVDDARANYRINLSQAYLLPSIDVSNYSFDNGMIGGVPYVQTYRDRFVYSPSLEAGYEFATRRRIVVVVRDTQSNFDHTVSGIARQNFNDISVLGGVAYDADGIIGFRLLGGYEQRNFESSAYKTIQAPILEGSASWTPTGLTTITATAARYIEDSAAENTVGYTETALKLGIDHELYRNIVLSGAGALYIDDYAGGGNQQYYTITAGVTWRLNRNLSLTGEYAFAARNASSSVPAEFSPMQQIFGSNYTDDVVLIKLKAAL